MTHPSPNPTENSAERDHQQTQDRERAADQLIERCGYAAAALALVPLPGTEIIAVMPVHVGMVVGLGALYDAPLDRDGAAELLVRVGGTVGASLIGTRLASTAAKTLLPGLGVLIAAPLLYATTLGLGAVVRAWLSCGGDLDPATARRVYRHAERGARRAFDPKQPPEAAPRA